MCYTTKTAGILTSNQIIDFIHRYEVVISVQTVTLCGGEVFVLQDIIECINTLTQKGIFVQIITNGTIDKLSQLKQPNLINLIISIDGLPDYHNQNRGEHRWQQSLSFIKKGLQLGFHAEIFSIVTKENLADIPMFENKLKQELNTQLSVTYHPRKPMSYLQKHPTSNQIGETNGFSFISIKDRLKLSKKHHIFPSPGLGCYQISLMSDGKVYGCCEGIHPLGSIESDINELISTFKQRIDHSSNCIEPDFRCGLCPKQQKGTTCHLPE